MKGGAEQRARLLVPEVIVMEFVVAPVVASRAGAPRQRKTLSHALPRERSSVSVQLWGGEAGHRRSSRRRHPRRGRILINLWGPNWEPSPAAYEVTAVRNVPNESSLDPQREKIPKTPVRMHHLQEPLPPKHSVQAPNLANGFNTPEGDDHRIFWSGFRFRVDGW